LIEFPCPVGYLCKPAPDPSLGYFCLPGACALCKSTEICRDEACVNPCDGVECADDETCVLGSCKDCTQIGCTDGKICFEGSCQEDACEGVSCAGDEFCYKGECKPSCDEAECGRGERCGASGSCERDRCAGVRCDSGQVCVGGACAADSCASLTCKLGDVCLPELGCVADPCPATKCPKGATCAVGDEGQPLCVAPPGSAKPARPDKRFVSGGGTGLSTACAVAVPGASNDSAALWLALPALIWTYRRTKRRSRSQSSEAR
jgi:hypothetical protein